MGYHFIYHDKTLDFAHALCIYVFRVIPTTSSNYFPK
jgi:hypothetical protein